jgi:phage-related protein
MAKAKRKKVEWMGSSLDDLRGFPEDVKDEVGGALDAVQQGEDHPCVKILKGFGGANVRELVSDDPSGTYRVVYTVRFLKAIYVLHSFQKKSKSGIKTPKEEMNRVVARLAEAEKHYAKTYG